MAMIVDSDTQSVYHKILQSYWGYSAFRPLQEEIIRSISARMDTLGLLPTGGGKSITFQVPALAQKGVCIVITPLISLMKDQVDNLKERQIKAVAIHSGMNIWEIQSAFDNVILGEYKFLYLSPERLTSTLFIEKLEQMDVSFIVVDEAHCISQWGYDFRPSYLNVASIRKLLPDTPILALTATATPEVVEDIQQKLLFKKKNVFQQSFDRKNLHYVVRHTQHKERELLHILLRTKGTAIVYVRSREATQRIADYLLANQITASSYHAGLLPEEKEQRQDQWRRGVCRVMVATNAFGMGIDKPDVRVVVHMDSPSSIEEYYQEAGRAGRDNQKAYAVMLYTHSDKEKLAQQLKNETPSKELILQVYEYLSYFFQIPIDTGRGRKYPFNIEQFCESYKLPLSQTKNAIKILELSGYITQHHNTKEEAYISILISRTELYNVPLENPVEELLETIMRTHIGVFSKKTPLDIQKLVDILYISTKEIDEMLRLLAFKGVIYYKPPQSVGTSIEYMCNRVPMHFLSIPSEVYEIRQKKILKRITAIEYYLSSSSVCRSKILLSYLGEKKLTECGRCDVCIQKKKKTLSHHSFARLQKIVMDYLSIHHSFVLREVPRIFAQEDPKEIIEVVRFLAQANSLQISTDKVSLLD